MDTRSSRKIHHAITIDASTQAVFDYLVQPHLLKKWFVQDAETDPRPGGRWWFDFGSDAGGRIGGQYVQVEPPTKLIWSWNEWNITRDFSPSVPEPQRNPPWVVTVCEITITGNAAGSTLLLQHHGYPNTPDWDQSFSDIDAGWGVELERLRTAVESLRAQVG